MNPGTLDTPITLQVPGTDADELGQPVESWVDAGTFFAARRRPRIQSQRQRDELAGGRETELREIVFRVRSHPFARLYQPGMRIVEPRRSGLPPVEWGVDGWSDVDGTRGMFIDIACSTPDAR